MKDKLNLFIKMVRTALAKLKCQLKNKPHVSLGIFLLFLGLLFSIGKADFNIRTTGKNDLILVVDKNELNADSSGLVVISGNFSGKGELQLSNGKENNIIIDESSFEGSVALDNPYVSEEIQLEFIDPKDKRNRVEEIIKVNSGIKNDVKLNLDSVDIEANETGRVSITGSTSGSGVMQIDGEEVTLIKTKNHKFKLDYKLSDKYLSENINIKYSGHASGYDTNSSDEKKLLVRANKNGLVKKEKEEKVKKEKIRLAKVKAEKERKEKEKQTQKLKQKRASDKKKKESLGKIENPIKITFDKTKEMSVQDFAKKYRNKVISFDGYIYYAEQAAGSSIKKVYVCIDRTDRDYGAFKDGSFNFKYLYPDDVSASLFWIMDASKLMDVAHQRTIDEHGDSIPVTW